MRVLARFFTEERGDGTTGSALRIGFWVVVCLGLLVGVTKFVIYPLYQKSVNCANAAASTNTTTNASC